MLTIDIITLFPQLFSPFLENLPLKRALEKDLVSINLVNLRDFAVDRYGSVDDKPYGGGAGMIIRIEPMYNALKTIYEETSPGKLSVPSNEKVLLLSPRGKTHNQENARALSKLGRITLLCGRYEGVDERVTQIFEESTGASPCETLSVGNYVLSGGEIPALAVIESVVRLLDGVIENEEALNTETFDNNMLEHPQYTRPEEFCGHKVPEILLSGDHKKIEEWKKAHMKPQS